MNADVEKVRAVFGVDQIRKRKIQSFSVLKSVGCSVLWYWKRINAFH